MDNSNAVPSEKRRATAVIAVHGVGDQKPFETARAIGDMLQDLASKPRDPTLKQAQCANPGSEKPRYFPFHEEALRINVNPVVMSDNDSGATQSAQSMRGPFNAWVQDRLDQVQIRKKGTEQTVTAHEKGIRKEVAEADLHTQFMKGQLMCYGGDDPKDTYETIRLEGERVTADGPPHDVHIYELYWADLSRLKAGIFSIFTELYQLLFHLSSLSAHTVNSAVLQHLDSRRWRWFRNFQSWAALTLTVPIPILNILMLGITAVVVGLGILKSASEKFHDAGTAFVAVMGGAVVATGLGLLVWRLMRKPGRTPGFFWWILPLVLGVATSSALLGIPCVSAQIFVYRVSIEAVILGLLSGLACWAILAQYNKRRPGLWSWTAVITASVAIVVAVSWCIKPVVKSGDGPWDANHVLLRAFESAYGVLAVAWGALFLLAILTWISGLLAAGINPLHSDKDTRSRWTGFLLLSMPTLIFSALTILGWAIIAEGIKKYLPSVSYSPFLPTIDASSAKPLADALLNIPATWILPLILVAMGTAALPAVWSLLPIVFAEVAPPTSDVALTPGISKRLGNWLSLAYRKGLLISGYILFAVSTFGLPTVALLAIVDPDALKYPGLQSLGVLSGAVLAWVFLARGSLKKLALGFRPALDLLLDVDNWLRENPLNKNPKARICGRYVSLLRYIANWKNADHPDGYEKIVIIAHSQGTVISADLLRFLNSETSNGKRWIELDPQLENIQNKSRPISFFTMGCPLRQLYGTRFPYLYGWAVHEVDKAMPSWRDNDLQFTDPMDPAIPGPDPERLGVALWVNAFRSGDYVGRHLWRTDVCEYLWEPDRMGAPVGGPLKSVSTDGRMRVEFCIGAGAHTHYWDITAPMIAEETDRLVQ